jgi:hypothetical protein
MTSHEQSRSAQLSAPAPAAGSPALQAGYLRALAILNPHQAHDLRARLGTVAIHLDLAVELLGSHDAAGSATPRARAEAVRAAAAVREVLPALEGVLALTRGGVAKVERFDAWTLIPELETALASAVRDRRLEWLGHPQGPPAFVEAERGALRQALVIVGAEALAALPHGGRLEAFVSTSDGRVALVVAATAAAGDAPASAASHPGAVDPLAAVRAAMDASGGRFRVTGSGQFELALPECAASR